MSYLIDTNVISELRKRQPDRGVSQWFARLPASALFVSVLTLGELRKGIESVTEQERKHRLLDWLERDLPQFFSGRVLNITPGVAACWGAITARAGRPVPAIDSLLAATALTHTLVLVTRNVKDFDYPMLEVIDPWVRRPGRDAHPG